MYNQHNSRTPKGGHMADPRVHKLAQVIIHYSFGLKPGDTLRMTGTTSAGPFLRELYREAVRAGAIVLPRITLEDFEEILLKEGSNEQLEHLPELLKQEIETIDASLTVWSSANTKQLSNVDPQRLALRRKTPAPLSQRLLQRAAAGELRWCGTLYPTEAHAQDAHMSLGEYEDFVYDAGKLNEPDPVAAWRHVHTEQQRIVDFLSQHQHIRIV